MKETGRPKGGTNNNHSKEEKLALVKRNLERESENHSVKELCDVYEVSRSGYYKWLKRKGTMNRYERHQTELDYYVADIHAHFPSQGYRSIADTLLNEYG